MNKIINERTVPCTVPRLLNCRQSHRIDGVSRVLMAKSPQSQFKFKRKRVFRRTLCRNRRGLCGRSETQNQKSDTQRQPMQLFQRQTKQNRQLIWWNYDCEVAPAQNTFNRQDGFRLEESFVGRIDGSPLISSFSLLNASGRCRVYI